MPKKRRLNGAKLEPMPTPRYQVIGDDGSASCPAPPGGKGRISLCQRPAKAGSKTIGNEADACAFMRASAFADRESIYAIHLDTRNRVIGVEEVAKGTISSVETSVREFFKAAIVNNATGVIMSHNHPSGAPSPSEDDVRITKAFVAAGKVLRIPVLDHVIVGSDGCWSMRSRPSGVVFDGATPQRRRRRR